jgi:hypothetical protein
MLLQKQSMLTAASMPRALVGARLLEPMPPTLA